MVAVKVVELVVAAVKVVGDDRRWWVGANERSNGWSRQLTTAATTRNTTERGQHKWRNKHEVKLGDRASARLQRRRRWWYQTRRRGSAEERRSTGDDDDDGEGDTRTRRGGADMRAHGGSTEGLWAAKEQ